MPDVAEQTGLIREITEHHDGHGLAEDLIIKADPLDLENGNASHEYQVTVRGDMVVADIQFQQGPRDDPDSTPGVLDSVLLAIVIDRMRSFQAGPFPSRENALVMTHCQEALHWMKHRADERANRGVLGQRVE